MLSYALSSNIWLAVTLIVAVSVITMLGMMAKIMRYEIQLIEVVTSARRMRIRIEQSIDEVEHEKAQEAANANNASKDSEDASTEDISNDSEQVSSEDHAQDENIDSSDYLTESSEDLYSNVDEHDPTVEADILESAAA